MPLYQGGGLTARRNAASHAVDAAQSTIQRTRLDVRQKLMEARSRAMSLASALQILRRQQQLSERTRELYQQQYLTSVPARCSTCLMRSRKFTVRVLPNCNGKPVASVATELSV